MPDETNDRIATLIEHASGVDVYSPEGKYLGTWHESEHAMSATPYFFYRIRRTDRDLSPAKPELAQVFWLGEWTV